MAKFEIIEAGLGIEADRLIGSDALAQVLRLAKICHSARDAALLEIAEADVAEQDRQDEEARSEDFAGYVA